MFRITKSAVRKVPEASINPDTRGARLEKLAKLGEQALVEDLPRMIARQACEAARLTMAS